MLDTISIYHFSITITGSSSMIVINICMITIKSIILSTTKRLRTVCCDTSSMCSVFLAGDLALARRLRHPCLLPHSHPLARTGRHACKPEKNTTPRLIFDGLLLTPTVNVCIESATRL
jgi:hypothetical protein